MLRGMRISKHDLRFCVFVCSGGEVAVIVRDFVRCAYAVLDEIAEGIFQSVGGELRGSIVSDRIPMIVADVRCGQSKLM